MASSILLAIALCAIRASAQSSTTTISMFMNMEDSHPTPIITGSIINADATATTYVANCDYTDDSEMCSMIDVTVTTGASWQAFTSSGSNGVYEMSCTFSGSVSAACEFGQSAERSSYSDTMTFDATNPLPGFMQVLVTGGVEKLNQDASATASSGSEQTGASSTASGQDTNGAKTLLPLPLQSLLALLAISGMLYL
ncbi:hypothetical protein H2200_010840 [Cladophialophora chaetospira]|uniref:Uncharacterized protein n=1 Tax=Cladophialophora chaetospira TaxID=386627 RepID=A0AA38X0U8_9EURO|nr:hypothetical protein H2200_010840 [Cladophialophora chaetospira]